MESYEERIPDSPTSENIQPLEDQSSRHQGIPANQEIITNYIASELSLIEPLSFGPVPLAQQSQFPGTSFSSTEGPSYCHAHGLISFGSSCTLQGQESSGTSMNHQCSQSDIVSPATRSAFSRHTSTQQNDPNSPPRNGKSSEIVWCKDALAALSTDKLTTTSTHLYSPAPQTINGSVDTERWNQKKNKSFQTGTHFITSKMKIPRYVFHPNEALRIPQKLADISGSFPSGSRRPLRCDAPQRSEMGENGISVSQFQENIANDQRIQELQDAIQNYAAALCLNRMAQSVNKNTPPLNGTQVNCLPTRRNQEQEYANNNNSYPGNVSQNHFPISNGYRQALLPAVENLETTWRQPGNIPPNTMPAQFTPGASGSFGASAQFTPYPNTLPASPPFSPFFDATVMGQPFRPHQSYASGNTRDWNNEQDMFHSPLPTAVRPRPPSAGYAFDPVPLLHIPRTLGYQAPVPFVPKGFSILQYPDPRAMFREANLLRLDNATVPFVNESPQTRKSVPFVSESPQRASSLQEETSSQDETPPQKQANSPSVPVKRTRIPNQCKICSKVCARASSLKIHMRTHTGEKPFTCKFCKRTFAQTGGLKSHVRTHTGERPYKCDFCDRCFSHSTAVANHKRIHTGERPFACDHEGCGKSFADQSTLKKHYRTHTGEKPFHCPYCTKKFTQLGNMNKHVQRKHVEKKNQ